MSSRDWNETFFGIFIGLDVAFVILGVIGVILLVAIHVPLQDRCPDGEAIVFRGDSPFMCSDGSTHFRRKSNAK